jgi:hypothetical protein
MESRLHTAAPVKVHQGTGEHKFYQKRRTHTQAVDATGNNEGHVNNDGTNQQIITLKTPNDHWLPSDRLEDEAPKESNINEGSTCRLEKSGTVTEPTAPTGAEERTRGLFRGNVHTKMPAQFFQA